MAFNQKIIILGSDGFIGKHIKNCIRNKNNGIEFIGLSSKQINLSSESSIKNISNLFDNKTTVIFLPFKKRQFSDSKCAFEYNIKLILNFCNLIEERKINHIIFYSSTAVYGEDIQNYEINELNKIEPTSYYGMAKYISEKLLWKTVVPLTNTSLLILRPPTIYGPGDKGGTYGPVLFTQKALKREMITLWGDGSELREFMDVRDLAEITYKLILTKAEGLYNVTHGKRNSFVEVLKILEKHIGEKISICSRSRTKRKADQTFSNAKIMNILKGYSFINLEDGLKDLCEYYLKNQNLLRP